MHPANPTAEMDAAVKKAEDAERRMRRAEDGPLESMAADDDPTKGADQPATGPD